MLRREETSEPRERQTSTGVCGIGEGVLSGDGLPIGDEKYCVTSNLGGEGGEDASSSADGDRGGDGGRPAAVVLEGPALFVLSLEGARSSASEPECSGRAHLG